MNTIERADQITVAGTTCWQISQILLEQHHCN